jgi:hypothetical protein
MIGRTRISRISKPELDALAARASDICFLEYGTDSVTASEIGATDIAGWIPQEN